MDRIRTKVPALVIALCTAAYALLAWRFSTIPAVTGTFDAVFDADVSRYLEWFTVGADWSFIDAAHPLLRYEFSLPHAVFVAPWKSQRLSLLWAFGIPVLAGAASLALFDDALRRAGSTPSARGATLLLAGGSFTGLVFFSLPEQFALSALATCWAMRGMAMAVQGRATALRWRCAAALWASGIVITNVVPFALLELLVARCVQGRSWAGAAVRAAVRGLAVVLAVWTVATGAMVATRLAAGEGLHRMFGVSTSMKFVARTSIGDTLEREARWLGDSFVPGRLHFGTLAELPFPDQRPPQTLSLPMVTTDWRAPPDGKAVVAWAGLLVLAVLRWKPAAALWPMWAACAALVAWHLLLFGVYAGHDLLLYSQHVVWPMAFVAVGGAAGRPRTAAVVSWIVAAMVGALALGDAVALMAPLSGTGPAGV